MVVPRYPKIEVSTPSRNPMTLVAKVRWAMRRAQVRQREIDRFTEQALSAEPARRRSVCRSWVQVA